MFVASGKRKDIRKGFVNKFVSLFYKVYPRKKEIELLIFHDNRQDPGKKAMSTKPEWLCAKIIVVINNNKLAMLNSSRSFCYLLIYGVL